ncbi:hypothetical protein GCM10027299_56060 [Larkinella ripae]
MSENKFLKNLGQPSPPPAETSADPIQRLTAELSRQSQAIEQLTALLKGEQQQPPAATYEQVKALHDQPVELDIRALAEELGPALMAVLPTAQRIQEAGAAAAQQVAKAAARIPRDIRVPGSILGFTSWQSLVITLGVFCGLFFGLGWYAEHQASQARYWEGQATQSTERYYDYKQFVDWLSTQKSYKQAVQQYNQQLNKGEKKR